MTELFKVLLTGEGMLMDLSGANGAGKTTTLHTVTGLLPAKSGTVTFEGKNITR